MFFFVDDISVNVMGYEVTEDKPCELNNKKRLYSKQSSCFCGPCNIGEFDVRTYDNKMNRSEMKWPCWDLDYI